ncbi:hypothetical protein C2S52_007923 [Perilla frutescens var. hirtella]|nr:hypothetical protein C2S52_007923 [Perilla frutescens var. hirtella]
MAAYAALLSLAQTTDLTANQDNQYRLSFDAESKIRSIHDEYVNFLLSFLENFPEKATRWEDKVREVTHKIEDIIQHYMWQQMKSMRPSSEIFEGQLKKLTEEIGLIVGQMMEERPAYLPAAVVSVSPPVTTGKDTVIGLHDDVTAIKDRLCGQSSKLRVVPIVGMGGIGKTTLARTVYDDPLILYHFDIRAWVTVSQDYSPHKLRKILLGLLDSVKLLKKEFSGEKIHECGEVEEEEQVLGEMIEKSDIALKVYQSLKGKRYLIVMDDVWRTDVWDDLRNVFPDDNNGSRIMLTTRLSDLATYPDFGSPLHEMRFMDDHQSWDLLKKKVFTNSRNFPPELEDVGKEIARKCAGLPLAIVLVAGVLSAANTSQAFCKEIARNVNLVVKEELEEILSFSYTHLPHHLRPCFLYIGGFPEDEEIHASRLIKLWVAEGFLKHQFGCSKSLEDEAEVYLDNLVKRNLVLVTSRKTNGKIKSCGLHDTVRDMCVRKAREEKFLRVLDGRDLPQGMINERHISFNHSDINGILGPTIRSILCFQLQSFPGWAAFLGNSTMLKVLNGVSSSANAKPPLPSQVFDRIHLKHLVLIGSFNIPSAISNLVNLQTLIIQRTFRQKKRNWRESYRNAYHFSLPLEIWRMRQLRHLILYDLYMLPPPPDGSNLPLEKLQTLSPLENLVWNEKMVQMIPNVKKLGLVYSFNKEYNLHHLNYLHQLEKLQVTGYNYFSWRSQNRIAFFSMTLQKLSLVGVKFPWEDMGIIGSLPNLQVLKLLNHACVGETWETGDGEFPQLKFLLIDTSRLRQWTTQGSSSFPMLRRLVLRSCVYLQEIPESIGEILTLELIEVDYCGWSLVESVEKIREDQQSYGNDALQVRVIYSDEVRLLPCMAAYVALLSLAQTINQDNQYRFSSDAESKIRFIHGYVNFLLSFLKKFPEKATRWEHKVREVAHKIEDIIHDYVWQQMKSMRPSSEIFEDRLQHLTEEIGLIVGEMMEERPAYLPAAAVNSV